MALVAHPDDERYQPLFGQTVRTPLFGVEVPVVAHRLAEPDKGSGIAMICTFGDLTDVTWWRELQLPTRAVIGWDGRLVADPPPGLECSARSTPTASWPARRRFSAQQRIVELLRESGDLDGEPRPITHPVKFFEKGERPLEIVTTRQWYIRNGGRDAELREALVARGREIRWVPEHMRHRYENWVEGLNGDWLISRQRFFGVPFPVWYRLDTEGDPIYDEPILAAEEALPVDPSSDVPPGFDESQRGGPGGFIADPDVMDTWATSSLSPQIASGWDDRPGAVRRGLPDGPAAAGARHHPHLAVLHRRPVALRVRHGAVVARGDLRLRRRPRPQEDVEVEGQRGDADRRARAVRHRRGALAGRGRPARRRLAVRRGADEGRPAAGHQDAQRRQVRARAGRLGGAVGASRSPSRSTAALLAGLAAVVDEATAAMDAYNYTRALEVAEAFFWSFCDDYVELVKSRAYGSGAAAESAQAALATALSVLLRLFAPVLPFVTEEVWSWWQERLGAPRARGRPRPSCRPAATRRSSPCVAEALAGVRKAKSDAKVSMRADVASATVTAPAGQVPLVEAARGDLIDAGRIASLSIVAGEGR